MDTLRHKKLLLLLFSGRFYFAKWCVFGDDLNYTVGELLNFVFPFDELSKTDEAALMRIADKLNKQLDSTLQYKLNAGKYVGTYNTSKLWDITDESDAIFLKYITDCPVIVQEELKTFVSQMAIAFKKESQGA